MNRVFEEASDSFLCLPSDSDARAIEDAFVAIRHVYLRAWRAAQEEGSPSSTSSDLEQWAIDNAVISPRCRALAYGLGSAAESVFRYYVKKAVVDCASGFVPNAKDEFGEAYTPWIFIGFPLPFDQVTVETTEDGLDWLRFGEIGPIVFGFTGDLPSLVHTVCFRKTADYSTYEVVFVGHHIDPAGGELL